MMLIISITASIIVLISLAIDITYSTDAKEMFKNNNDNDILKELLRRMDKMQSQIDKMENNNHIRFDQLDAGNKKQDVVMESIVEQQMVITSEIFTLSQTLPSCCHQHQSSTDPSEVETTKTTTPTALISLPTNCNEAMGENGPDGIYEINVKNSNIGSFAVYCMKKVARAKGEDIINGTWLVIQRRKDSSTDFHLDWKSYQRGFGALNGNFWIGLDKLYALTASTKQELWVQLKDNDGILAWAKYDNFAIGNEHELYKLNSIGRYDGTAGDSLSYHEGQKWSTFDKDNDSWNKHNCADYYKGGWWFNNCANSTLNGADGDNNDKCIFWETFRKSCNSLEYGHMAIRPRI